MGDVIIPKPNFDGINSRCRHCTHGCRRVAGDHLNTRFLPIKNVLCRTEMTVDMNSFEISPEMIKQELRPVVCKQRQTDRQI